MNEAEATPVADPGTTTTGAAARPGHWPMPSWGYRHFVTVLLGTWLISSGGVWLLKRALFVPPTEADGGLVILGQYNVWSILPEPWLPHREPHDILYSAAFLGLVALLVMARRATWRGMGFRAVRGGARVWVALGLFGGLLVLRFVSRLRHPGAGFMALRGTDSPVESYYGITVHSGWGGLALATMICVILLPVVHETLFRGLLYHRLRANLGVTASVLVSAAASAAFQPINLYWTVPLFVMGMFSAWLVESSRSLYPAFLANGLGNAVLLGLDFLP